MLYLVQQRTTEKKKENAKVWFNMAMLSLLQFSNFNNKTPRKTNMSKINQELIKEEKKKHRTTQKKRNAKKKIQVHNLHIKTP